VTSLRQPAAPRAPRPHADPAREEALTAPIDDIAIEPAQTGLLSAPLDWFVAEHQRHRQFCRLVAEAAESRIYDGGRLAQLATFIRRDLALHIVEEEEDLFPMLRRRARPEDQIEAALGRLSAEHAADAASAQVALAHLDLCLETRSAPGASAPARQALRAFASQELSHLALENAVVLPLARMRLKAGDLRKLSRGIAARRGVRLRATP
jgi:iron-sulfur cluster repair protein YtfE (RIC family)